MFGVTVAGGPSDTERAVVANFVTPGWFRTYGTPIVAGEEISMRATWPPRRPCCWSMKHSCVISFPAAVPSELPSIFRRASRMADRPRPQSSGSFTMRFSAVAG